MSQVAKIRDTVISRLFVIKMVLLAVRKRERKEGVMLKLNPILSTRDAAVGTVSSLRTGRPKNNVLISVGSKRYEGCPESIQPF